MMTAPELAVYRISGYRIPKDTKPDSNLLFYSEIQKLFKTIIQ
jgi:hypothetical protein